MKAWENIKLGWKSLEIILNTNIGAKIQERTPIQGSGILLEQKSTGVLISIDPANPGGIKGQGADSSGGSGSSDGAWVSIDVVDVNCNRSTIQVWSRPVPPV